MPFASRLGLMRSGLCCEWWLRRRLRNCSGLPFSPRLLMNIEFSNVQQLTCKRIAKVENDCRLTANTWKSHRRTALRGNQPNHLSCTTKSSQNRLLQTDDRMMTFFWRLTNRRRFLVCVCVSARRSTLSLGLQHRNLRGRARNGIRRSPSSCSWFVAFGSCPWWRLPPFSGR